ncbi:hypothetical protein [Streptomyces violaceorubidus]|uniref:Integrase SAM-like N-terminal domain-containing protein n=1 Tax=Streptomyces violaceorubidus TaxID=284042 RepID=A0ABV1T2V0_9ACTN
MRRLDQAGQPARRRAVRASSTEGAASVARAWVARSKKDHPKKWTTFWYDPDGKQRQKTFATKTRADDQPKRKEQELDAGTYLDSRLGKQPVTSVWEQWTNQRKLENSTKKQYRSIQRTTLEPFFKARSIVSLKSLTLSSGSCGWSRIGSFRPALGVSGSRSSPG